MRIGIFTVHLGRKVGGQETYERQLIKALAAVDRENEFHVFCLSHTARKALDLDQENFTVHVLWPNNRWLSIPMGLPVALRKSRVDFFHTTYVPPPFSPTPYVMTMHDTCIFAHPELYAKPFRKRSSALITRGLKRAKHILCSSASTRDLVAEHFGIVRERMAVIPLGVNESFYPIARDRAREAVRKAHGIDRPYILFVGQLRVSSKNLVRLLKAYDRFRHEVSREPMLVLAGRRVWDMGEFDETLAACRLRDDVRELGHVRDDDLPALYSGSEMFVLPSLCEGFGLPVLEAMACGAPVVASDIPCIAEVSNGVALLVDPYSISEVAAGMGRVYSDAGLRETMRSEGRKRAAAFTWENTARQTLDAYRAAMA